MANCAGFSHLSYPIPGQGKQVKRVVLFCFGFCLVVFGGYGERDICMECVLVRTEEDIRCLALLLFALSFTSLH